MAQNDPNDPAEPSPVSTATHSEETEAEAERDWRLFDAEEQSKKLRPTFVNRAFVKMEGRVLRISFGESVGDENIYRSSIVMSPEDAYELGQLLLSQAGSAYSLVLDHYRQVIDSLPKDEPHG